MLFFIINMLCKNFSSPHTVISGRGMYIAKHHLGCGNDWLWMVTIQDQISTPCSWERRDPAILPVILYAPGAEAAREDGGS